MKERSDATRAAHELVARVEKTAAKCRHVTAELLILLIEVELTGAHETLAYRSMHDFCIRHLKLSEGSAHRRIIAARLVQEFPRLLPMIKSGEVTLALLLDLRGHLSEDDFDGLIARTRGMTKVERRDFLAHRDQAVAAVSPATLRKLPTLRTNATVTHEGGPPPVIETRYAFKSTLDQDGRDDLEFCVEHLNEDGTAAEMNAIVKIALRDLAEKLRRRRQAERREPPAEAPTPIESVSLSAASADVPAPSLAKTSERAVRSGPRGEAVEGSRRAQGRWRREPEAAAPQASRAEAARSARRRRVVRAGTGTTG